MPVRLGSMPLARLSVAMLVLISVLAPFVASGAIWQLKDDAAFKAPGYYSKGIMVQDHVLKLAFDNKTVFQKTWTGSPGQGQFLDPTRYYSETGLDGSSASGLVLEKESWMRKADAPAASKEHIAVYDEARQQVIVYGGQSASGSLATTWSYRASLDNWTKLTDAPVSRHWHSGAWDVQNQRLLIHGGMSASGTTQKSFNDTYAFDPASSAWDTRANSTMKRYSHTSVWNPIDQRLLVFGGYGAGVISKDLWAYEPIGNTWELKAAAPVALYEHSAVWADGLNKMLVYGGLKAGGVASKDLWAYDPLTDTWSQLANGGTERSGQSATWNNENKQLIVFGGHVGQSNYNDTWIYDAQSNTWKEGRPLPGAPRTGATLIWSPNDKLAILYGGEDSTGILKEVWVYSPYYLSGGELVSSSYDMGASPELVNVSWTEDRSPAGCLGASIKVQLAGSLTLDPASYTFAGPEGTATYYANGQTISDELAGKKYIRYRVVFSTSDVKCTPVLKELKIGYHIYSAAGEYITASYDTGSDVVDLISASYTVDDPSGTEVQVYVRSSYTSDMTQATSWELLVSEDSDIKTQGRRFVQFKVTMGTTDTGKTPAIEKMNLVYNSIPQILTFPVSPDDGGSTTEFVYKVTYVDGDGETPTAYKVYIDGKEHDMQPETYDYRIGANFTYKTKLPSGPHTYKFEFSDGKNYTLAPATGDFKGPSVNDVPTAMLKVSTKAALGQKVKFDASGSTDPEGKLKSYKFDFGDGTNSGWVNESKVTHAYKKKGTFKVTVTVKDALGGQATSTEATIKVQDAGKGFIPAPGTGALMVAFITVALVFTIKKKRRA